MMKITASLALIGMLFITSLGVFAESYERSINRLGHVTKSQQNAPITRLAHLLLPDGWQLSFTDDDMRPLVVSWHAKVGGKVQFWHDALGQIGKEEQLVFLADGAMKHVFVTYPGYGREPGAQIINSTSIVFQEDKVTQEIMRRAKVNELNFKRRQMQQDLGQMHTQKVELANQLNQLNEERANIELQMQRLSNTTAEVVSVVEQSQKHADILQQAEQIKQKEQNRILDAASADFIFFVKSGLVLNDNAKRFAKDLGYDVLVVDKRVPANCDWYQEVEYTISSKDPRQAFAEYVAPYGFKTNFSGSMVELMYVGIADSFKGCAG